MNGNTKTRCTAITRAGKPCKSWAIVGSSPALCSAHAGRNAGAGAPRGNQNARKHGYYSHRFSTQELADPVPLAENDSLDDELALARVFLRRLFEYLDDAEDLDRNDLAALGPLIFSGTRHVARLLRAVRRSSRRHRRGQPVPPARQRLMRGEHQRQAGPAGYSRSLGKIYVATVDVGGQDEATTDPIAQLDNPARDYTVCHIFELDRSDYDAPGPTYRAVDVWVDHGSRHFQAVAGKPALVHRLLAYLRSWNVSHIVADATGVGEGLCDWLASAFGLDRVTQYKFSRLTKAQLGAGFLGVVETGRFQYWSENAETPLSDGWWFWQQCSHCIYEIKPGGTWERDLQWAVPASARVDTPAGLREVHDDRLISAALVSLYDELVLEGVLRTGQGKAAVIKGRDPLDEMGF